jgi:hypothetical protein
MDTNYAQEITDGLGEYLPGYQKKEKEEEDKK